MFEMVDIDFPTIIGGYTTVIGDPVLVGLFILTIGLIFSVRLGVSLPFMLSSGIVLVYLTTSLAGSLAYIPVGFYIILLFCAGVILYLAIKKIDSSY